LKFLEKDEIIKLLQNKYTSTQELVHLREGEIDHLNSELEKSRNLVKILKNDNKIKESKLREVESNINQ
jgi:hypothetical protein